MIFKHIEFSNFMLFQGRQRMEFIKPKEEVPENGLYLVLAANNAGKTSFIRALKFLFYGANSIGGGISQHSIVCQRTLLEANNNKTHKCYVEARIIHRGQEYTFKRELIYTRGTVLTKPVIVDERVSYIAYGSIHDEVVTDPKRFEMKVAQMVPEDLFNFFFFKGEELSHRLLEGNGDQSLQDSLMAIFQKEDWDLAEKHIKDIQKGYHCQVVAAQKHNAQAVELVDEKEELTKELETLDADLKKLAEDISSKESQVSKLDQKIIQAASSKNEKLKSEIASLDSQIRSKAAQINSGYKLLFHQIAESGPLALIGSSFGSVHAYLEDLRAKKVLPAEVSEDFFGRLLHDNKCVCERPLEKGSKERQVIEQKKALCLTSNLGQTLHRIANLLNPNSAVGYVQRATKGLATIKQEHKSIEKLRSEQLDFQEQLAARKKELEDLPGSDLQALVKQKNVIKEDLDELKYRRTTKQLEWQAAKDRFDEIKQQLEEMGVDHEANDHDLAGEKLCEELGALVKDMRDGLRNSFYSKLMKSVSELYKEIVTDQSTAVIDQNTLLPSIRLHGASGIAAGGAQSQALCLAYILSLAELRRQVAQELKELFYGSKSPTSGDQAFVMDSIFAPMGGNYIRETAHFLPGKAKQLILLLSHDQYDAKVQSEWEKKVKGQPIVTKAWRFLFHMTEDKYKKIQAEDRVATFRNTQVNLFKAIPKNEHQFAEIIPL